jgi:predicted nucleotide-binding protein (sugar kinase/HSP70/actin superfamily)
MDEANTIKEIKEAHTAGVAALKGVPQDPEREVLKVGIVGEIYVVLEPSANLELEEILGELEVEVDRSIFLTGWTIDNAIVDAIRVTGGRHVKRAAKEYLPEMIGGHGQDSIGHTIIYAKDGFDGVIQLSPFTCIPEIVAKSILPKVSKDYDIPVLSIVLDEQTGKAGLTTRVEAFVDLLYRRRHQRLEAGV